MSWQIPQQIEQDIIAGKAQYRTFQTGVGGQSILPVPNNAYAVVYGYDFSPAGGGFVVSSNPVGTGASSVTLNVDEARVFETQQISFYTGADFYPFVHHVNTNIRPFVAAFNPITGETTSVRTLTEIDNTPISRQVYITSDKDITISVGLIVNSQANTTGVIPITNRTPALLTYGGSPQALAVQTDFGPAGNPLQFMQPSPKDFQDFGFGLLPNNANGQSFATPDAARGLVDPSVFLAGIAANIRNAAAANYFLCLHYALYTRTIPEQRG
jgi:hypothetical protein